MKNILKRSIKMLIAFVSLSLILVSCEYQEVANADYPDQILYMPTAVSGNYVINNVPKRFDFLPTPGQTNQFTVEGTKFIVPLGVYRSGIDRNGKVTASIAIDNDTIAALLAANKLPAASVIIPSNNISFPSSVDVASGSEVNTFNLEIDLNYLRSLPDGILTLGISIASNDAVVNPLLNTTVLVIYTKILKPTARFTSAVDATNAKKIVFTNTSTYGMTYSWNFGDGTAVVTETSPTHVFSAAGTYNVTLTTVGVTGNVDKATFTTSVVVN